MTPRLGVLHSEAESRLSVRHALSVNDFSDNDIELIMRTAESFVELTGRPIKKVPTLRGKTVATLFYESSTRTRVSFELAAKRLSADTVSIALATSSVTKGESLKDTAQTLTSMGVDAVILRHHSPGAALRLTHWTDAIVLNAGDGAHQHPSQALLDVFTLRRRLGSIAGKKILVVGDILFSRVARSTIALMVRGGADVVAVGPPTLVPDVVASLGCRISYNLDTEIADADVIYLLRMQKERRASGSVPSITEYVRLYSLTAERMAAARPQLVVMHPGPMNRGIEIDSSVADLPDSAVLDQVESGVAIRMALLYLLLGGPDGISA